ncbi:hypothetical protein O6H91_Y336800 [Diphasiastrum complanatum]|nr:hypothetical protein O6H91_Y336800 [Diphasiastrum complanatum]KAJ7285376.1 hypothetical protein O6H91_Y336800 [Diphasiastrum complanatum]KAJ7285378.1 hypothetical protein O6H91_Y336800 [Diphasiastrum complanatum]
MSSFLLPSSSSPLHLQLWRRPSLCARLYRENWLIWQPKTVHLPQSKEGLGRSNGLHLLASHMNENASSYSRVVQQPQIWYFAIANAQSLMAGKERDVWLIFEPAFISELPGLKALNGKLKKPTAAILSTNAEWMLKVVKNNLPQAVIGKFLAPSAPVPNPLKSSLRPGDVVVGDPGVWH